MAQAASANYAEEQRQQAFLDIVEDLRKCDLEEVSRRTKRWGRKGVSVGTLYRWLSADAPIWPHWRTILMVGREIGWEEKWVRHGIPKGVLRIRSV